ncbi:hypothetical protein D3C76_1856750 [compost metagenome]
MFGQRDKALGGAIQGGDAPAFDVVDPAVQVQAALFQGQCDAGVGLQVGQLGHHVFPDQ